MSAFSSTDPFLCSNFARRDLGFDQVTNCLIWAFPPLIKFKPLIRWETVFFLPLTSSRFALHICHLGNITLWERVRSSFWSWRRQDNAKETSKGSVRDSWHTIDTGTLLLQPKRWRSVSPISFVCQSVRVFVLCAQGGGWFVFKSLLLFSGLRGLSYWRWFTAVLPAEHKSPGPISVAVCYSLKDQVLQGKLEVTTEK